MIDSRALLLWKVAALVELLKDLERGEENETVKHFYNRDYEITIRGSMFNPKFKKVAQLFNEVFGKDVVPTENQTDLLA